MPTNPLSLTPHSPEIRKAGHVVGMTDRVYEIVGDGVMFEDVLVRGDLSGPLEYNGITIEVTGVQSIFGLEVGPFGARGPVWKGVQCRVLPK